MRVIFALAGLSFCAVSQAQLQPWDWAPKMSFSLDATTKSVNGAELFQSKLSLCDKDTYKVVANDTFVEAINPNPSYSYTINSGSLYGSVGAEYNATTGVKVFTHSIVADNPSMVSPGTVVYRQDTYIPTDTASSPLKDLFTGVDKCIVTVAIKAMR